MREPFFFFFFDEHSPEPFSINSAPWAGLDNLEAVIGPCEKGRSQVPSIKGPELLRPEMVVD